LTINANVDTATEVFKLERSDNTLSQGIPVKCFFNKNTENSIFNYVTIAPRSA